MTLDGRYPHLYVGYQIKTSIAHNRFPLHLAAQHLPGRSGAALSGTHPLGDVELQIPKRLRRFSLPHD